MKEIHFFDLDNTLWEIKCNIWIIDKEKPNEPLIKLEESDFIPIKMGKYLNDDLEINYNGSKYWLSQELYDRICKYKKYPISSIGISFREFIDNSYIKKVKYLLSNVSHLKNYKNLELGILSARYNKHNDEKFLTDLIKKLKDNDFSLSKIIYISDKFQNTLTDDISFKKCNTIIEHLIGVKIKDGGFVPIKNDGKYDSVYFYDDEIQNIYTANEINSIISELLKNTETELYNMILEDIEIRKPKLITNWVTGNDVNKFKSTLIEIKNPIKFPIKESLKIKLFSEFKSI